MFSPSQVLPVPSACPSGFECFSGWFLLPWPFRPLIGGQQCATNRVGGGWASSCEAFQVKGIFSVLSSQPLCLLETDIIFTVLETWENNAHELCSSYPCHIPAPPLHSSFLPLSLLLSFSPSCLPFFPFIKYLWSTHYELSKASTCIKWDGQCKLCNPVPGAEQVLDKWVGGKSKGWFSGLEMHPEITWPPSCHRGGNCGPGQLAKVPAQGWAELKRDARNSSDTSVCFFSAAIAASVRRVNSLGYASGWRGEADCDPKDTPTHSYTRTHLCP